MTRTPSRVPRLASVSSEILAILLTLKKENCMRSQRKERSTKRNLSTAFVGGALIATPFINVWAADVNLPPVSVGAGVRTSFAHTNPEVGENAADFALNSARIYISGKATENISLMFNTENAKIAHAVFGKPYAIVSAPPIASQAKNAIGPNAVLPTRKEDLRARSAV